MAAATVCSWWVMSPPFPVCIIWLILVLMFLAIIQVFLTLIQFSLCYPSQVYNVWLQDRASELVVATELDSYNSLESDYIPDPYIPSLSVVDISFPFTHFHMFKMGLDSWFSTWYVIVTSHSWALHCSTAKCWTAWEICISSQLIALAIPG